MPFRAKNIYSETGVAADTEQFVTLFKNDSVKIERIVSHSHASPAGFWYDQFDDEWVIVLRGSAVLEFIDGEVVDMTEGDYLFIPRRVRHRVARTGAATIWLAVHLR
jgi:cupin 2 domain-containing protein